MIAANQSPHAVRVPMCMSVCVSALQSRQAGDRTKQVYRGSVCLCVCVYVCAHRCKPVRATASRAVRRHVHLSPPLTPVTQSGATPGGLSGTAGRLAGRRRSASHTACWRWQHMGRQCYGACQHSGRSQGAHALFNMMLAQRTNCWCASGAYMTIYIYEMCI